MMYIHFLLPLQLCSVLRVEVKGPQNNVRVRQVQMLALPNRRLDCSLTPALAQQRACEEEALRVFRLLTSQVCIVHMIYISFIINYSKAVLMY